MSGRRNTKAVSTFVLIILMLCCMVFGAFLSYMWVISNFYLEPENTVDLIIVGVDFPVDHANYFYVTVMNPSHSPSGTNITKIYFTVEGEDKVYSITGTYPEELPILIERGTSKTVKCLVDWGEFAGKTITVHVFGANASGAVGSATTEFVKLELETEFNATVSCKQFNVTVRNHPQSAINLTLTKVTVDGVFPENITLLPSGENVTLPISMPVNQSFSLECFYDWENLVDPGVRVDTAEGYHAEKVANATASILLLVDNVVFNETNPEEISITVFNSQVSSTLVDIVDIVLTDSNGTEYHIDGSQTDPAFAPYYRLETNETVTFNHCVWNWRDYRDEDVTVTVYVKQGFTPASKTVTTPQPIVFKITELRFNLTNTGFFLVNVTNMPCSLQDINITQIEFNENSTSFESQIVPIGQERQLNCTFDWKDFRGESVNITVCTEDGLNISETITLPSVDLKILVEEPDFAKSTEGILHVNVTISNTVFSAQNVTITQIIFGIENTTEVIPGTLTNPKLVPEGYLLVIDANVTIVCPWDWIIYPNQNLTITVQTAEGFSVSRSFQIPESTP